jgi:hypothetical protein
MRKILIAGDSWGCGEWGFNNGPTYQWSPLRDGTHYLSNNHSCHGVIHLGLEEYLSEQNTVLNVSVPGSTNGETVVRLELAMRNFRPDIVLWIQTDPIRDYRDPNRYSTLRSELLSLARLRDLHTISLERTYDRLNSLGVPIHCLGGTTKIDSERLRPYDNLIPFLPSMIAFINPSLIEPVFWISEWVQEELMFTDECMIQLEKDKHLLDILSADPCFSTCGHPKREGLRKIYEYINETRF